MTLEEVMDKLLRKQALLISLLQRSAPPVWGEKIQVNTCAASDLKPSYGQFDLNQLPPMGLIKITVKKDV